MNTYRDLAQGKSEMITISKYVTPSYLVRRANRHLCPIEYIQPFTVRMLVLLLVTAMLRESILTNQRWNSIVSMQCVHAAPTS